MARAPYPTARRIRLERAPAKALTRPKSKLVRTAGAFGAEGGEKDPALGLCDELRRLTAPVQLRSVLRAVSGQAP